MLHNKIGHKTIIKIVEITKSSFFLLLVRSQIDHKKDITAYMFFVFI